LSATPIIPAILELDAEGTPYAPRYGDIYHSRAGAQAQAREVFLAGNGLPGRWAGRRSFTILEAGFGLGSNCLATWSAWQGDPRRCGRLHFVAIEKHPFLARDLLVWHARDPAIAMLAERLAPAWPVLTPGVHRIELDDGRMILTLALGEFGAMLARLRCAVDAFYLDGFAPSRNPDAWDEQVFKGIARLALPGATVATYTVARAVADGLTAAGFEVHKAPGFGGKRDKLVGRYAPRYRMRRYEPPMAPAWPERRALVIGAGIAGIAVADRLAARGWQVRVLEADAGIARAGSGTPAGALHPLVARDDSLLARLTRAGFLRMQASLERLQSAAARDWFSACGHLDCAGSDAEEARIAAVVAELGFPDSFVTAVDAAAASELAGTRVARGGYWFPGGAWLNAAAWCAAVAARRPELELRTGAGVATLRREDGAWVARDAAGHELARAPVAVLAAGTDPARLTGALPLPLQRVRGQLSGIAASACRAPRVVVSGDGYCLPPVDGVVWTGASYGPDDADATVREAEHQSNLRHLAQLLPDNDFAGGAPSCAGHVGFRAVAPDRMPLVGALPDLDAVKAGAPHLSGAHLRDLPRQTGLYVAGGMASRGLSWSALTGETLADLIEGEPPPLESDLLDAIDPARFLLQQLRRGGV
jgi:tRNA 5-methylaminomethyl-2-thiouridine biosynthesis bifunctional protein